MANDLPRFLTALVSSREEKSCLNEPFTRSQIVSRLDGPIFQCEHQRDNWGYSKEKYAKEKIQNGWGKGEKRGRTRSYRIVSLYRGVEQSVSAGALSLLRGPRQGFVTIVFHFFDHEPPRFFLRFSEKKRDKEIVEGTHRLMIDRSFARSFDQETFESTLS